MKERRRQMQCIDETEGMMIDGISGRMDDSGERERRVYKVTRVTETLGREELCGNVGDYDDDNAGSMDAAPLLPLEW